MQSWVHIKLPSAGSTTLATPRAPPRGPYHATPLVSASPLRPIGQSAALPAGRRGPGALLPGCATV
eukprot:3974885-Pyramimonas_sp.AAC.1